MHHLNVTFIRHGETQSNVLGLTSGHSDVLLSPNGWDMLKALKSQYHYPSVEKVYASPAIRCRETASVIFPNQTPHLVENFWEFDFGIYDNQPVTELFKTVDLNKWLNQDKDLYFTGGESLLEASFRARAAMTRVICDALENDLHNVAIVAHGEIFSLLLQYCLITDEPRESFILCPNGMGYTVTLNAEDWFDHQKFYFECFVPEGAPRPRAEDSPYFSNVEADISDDSIPTHE